MGRAQLEELERRGRYFSVPRGVSMWPMIRNKKDIVEVRRLDGHAERGDVVLYVRGESLGVIHRVYRRRRDTYVIAGDNCWQFEHVPADRVVGRVETFYRNGAWHSVDDGGYRLYVRIWMLLFPVRRVRLYCLSRLRRIVRLRRSQNR